MKERSKKKKKNSPSSPARARPTIPAPTMATSNVESSSSRCEEAREEGEEDEKGRRQEELATEWLASPVSPAPLKKKFAAAQRDSTFPGAEGEEEARAAAEDANFL